MLISRSNYLDPDDEEAWAGKMVEHQFSALSHHLTPNLLAVELKALPYFIQFKRPTTIDTTPIRRWCHNGWNTEHLLNHTRDVIAPDMLSCAIPWAFPQLYYSAFALALAYFSAAGFNEIHHATVLAKISKLMAAHKYPGRMSFLADGLSPFSFSGIAKFPTSSAFHYDPFDEKSVQTQIGQFLSATRKIDLKNRKKKTQFDYIDSKTKETKKKKKKRLTKQEWLLVSKYLGATSIFDLLYRKRIQANYQAIDSLLSQAIDGNALIQSLGQVVNALNFVHEAFIAKAIGIEKYSGLVNAINHKTAPARRLAILRSLLSP